MMEITSFVVTGLAYFILFVIAIFLIFIALAYLGGLLVPRNENNQKAIDKATEKLLNTPIEDLLTMPRHVEADMQIDNENITYVYFKDKLNDSLIHIILEVTQKTKFGFYYKFLNGIKIIDRKEVRRLTDDEIADYD